MRDWTTWKLLFICVFVMYKNDFHKCLFISSLTALSCDFVQCTSFDTDWINTSYVSETLVDAREDQMTETGFSKMSWFHKEDRLFQYSVVSEMIEACTGCCCWYKRGLIYTWLSESVARGSADVHPTPLQPAQESDTASRFEIRHRFEGLTQLDP